MQIVVDSLLTNYQAAGEGKVVLLLHGWGDDMTTFNALKTELLKTYEVVCLDLPGFGKTEPPKEAWGLDDFASFVADFLTKLAIKPHAIIGHSNGGAIAVRGLSKKMFGCDKLILLASSGIRNQYSPKNKIIRLAAKSAKVPVGLMPQSWQKSIKKKAYKAIGSDLFVAEHMQETFKKIIEDDIQNDAATITQPTLLIYGQEDTATPPSDGKLLADHISNSSLNLIPNCGHFVLHDQARNTADLIKDFLK